MDSLRTHFLGTPSAQAAPVVGHPNHEGPPRAQTLDALPFFVSPVLTIESADKVLALRRWCYSRHNVYTTQFLSALHLPDAQDQSGVSTTLAATCKSSGQVWGTLRLTCSMDAQYLLPEEIYEPALTQSNFVLIDRFAVNPLGPKTVMPSLMKACWMWTIARGAQWIAGLAIAPLAQRYQRWGGLKIVNGGRPILVVKDLTVPVFLVAATTHDCQQSMRQNNPAFGIEFAEKAHPDIGIVGPLCFTDSIRQAWAHTIPEAVPQNTLFEQPIHRPSQR